MKRIIAIALLLCTAAAAREPRWPRPPPPPPAPSTPAKAATEAANGPACSAQAPFYWEIGNASGKLAAGTVGGTTFTQTTPMAIASASKIYYSAYAAQVRKGVYSPEDVKYLTFKSGYSALASCRATDTMGSCAARAPFDPATVDYFDYGGGHMQVHGAKSPDLFFMKASQFTTEVNKVLGTSVKYGTPQPAGGITTTAAETAAFLRALMTDKLELGKHLGEAKICTKCPQALGSPVREPWFYAVGHWVELDGTFSSPGAFGYYPFITADKRFYGIVARKASGGAWASVTCGRAIRQAFLQ